MFFLHHAEEAEGVDHLFRVQDANLRARVALQALERWPLSACLDLIDFCLNDPDTHTSLNADLELKKKELSIYRWVTLNLNHPFFVFLLVILLHVQPFQPPFAFNTERFAVTINSV